MSDFNKVKNAWETRSNQKSQTNNQQKTKPGKINIPSDLLPPRQFIPNQNNNPIYSNQKQKAEEKNSKKSCEETQNQDQRKSVSQLKKQLEGKIKFGNTVPGGVPMMGVPIMPVMPSIPQKQSKVQEAKTKLENKITQQKQSIMGVPIMPVNPIIGNKSVQSPKKQEFKTPQTNKPNMGVQIMPVITKKEQKSISPKQQNKIPELKKIQTFQANQKSQKQQFISQKQSIKTQEPFSLPNLVENVLGRQQYYQSAISVQMEEIDQFDSLLKENKQDKNRINLSELTIESFRYSQRIVNQEEDEQIKKNRQRNQTYIDLKVSEKGDLTPEERCEQIMNRIFGENLYVSTLIDSTIDCSQLDKKQSKKDDRTKKQTLKEEFQKQQKELQM